MTATDVVLKVLESQHEMSKDEAYHCASKMLGHLPEGVSVGDIYTMGHNLEYLGKNLVWALSHNQMDQTKNERFVPGEDIQRVLL